MEGGAGLGVREEHNNKPDEFDGGEEISKINKTKKINQKINQSNKLLYG